jgi:hypothetical protein
MKGVSRATALTLRGLACAVIAAVVPLAVLAHQNPVANAGSSWCRGRAAGG